MYKNKERRKMNGNKSNINVPQTLFGNVNPITIDQEISLVKKIQEGKEFIPFDDEDINKEQRNKKKRSLDAAKDLIIAYSPLIEGVAKNNFKKSGHDRIDIEDFINEAYIVALQCCYTFDPYASKNSIIRFSSYAPRAITSALQRMSNRTRPVVSVPTTVMSDARKWSHVLFDMKNRGIDISDEEVSNIAGVKSSQTDIRSVLGLSQYADLDDIDPPFIEEKADITPYDDELRILKRAIKEVFPEHYEQVLYVLGLNSEKSLNTPFLLSASGIMSRYEAEDFLKDFSYIINHPSTRVKISEIIQEYDL